MSMGESFQFTEEELLAEAQSRVPNPEPAPDPTSSETTPDPASEETPDTEVEEEVEEEELEEEETPEEEEEETPPAGYSLTLQDGSTIQVSPEEILAYYQVDQRLKHDKHFAEYLNSYTPPTPGGGGNPGTAPCYYPPTSLRKP